MGKREIEKDFAKIKKYCKVIRVIAHTQVRGVGVGCLDVYIIQSIVLLT